MLPFCDAMKVNCPSSREALVLSQVSARSTEPNKKQTHTQKKTQNVHAERIRESPWLSDGTDPTVNALPSLKTQTGRHVHQGGDLKAP